VVTKSKIVVNATIVALSYAGPVFAQSFNRSDGTGNELPSYYDSAGGLHAGGRHAVSGSRALAQIGRQRHHLY
jgi:hypothetical protein